MFYSLTLLVIVQASLIRAVPIKINGESSENDVHFHDNVNSLDLLLNTVQESSNPHQHEPEPTPEDSVSFPFIDNILFKSVVRRVLWIFC